MNRSSNMAIKVGLLSGLLLLGAERQVLASEEHKVARNDQQADLDLFAMYFSDENLVEVTSRVPQPLPRVAENYSIVTAEQIEAMGVHSVDEVLSQLPGMIVTFNHRNFGDFGTYRTHGLGFIDAPHVLLLIDGVRLNPPSQARAETNGIPLQIIKRIEVIKGPASSVWGSSLGGVINIITKDTGKTVTPRVTMSASGGEANTQDYNADIAARVGHLSYYLYAGRQDSQGLRNDRWFANNRLYGKLETALGDATKIGLALGSSNPEYLEGNSVSSDTTAYRTAAHSWGSLSLETSPMTGVALHLALQSAKMDWWRQDNMLSTGAYLWAFEYADETRGGEATLAISRWPGQSIVLGAELERDEMEMRSSWDVMYPIYQEKRAVFLNDSITWGPLTVTPGLRYDHSSLIGEQTSPSLAAVYRLDETTLLRFNAGSGFAQMPLLHFLPFFNPQIKPEMIKSIQGGVETTIMAAVRFKTTLFHHGIKKTIDYNTSTNTMPIQRDGIEAEIETLELYGFSAGLNGTYIHERNRLSGRNPPLDIDGTNDDITAINLAFSYRYADLLRTRLAGHYLWQDRVEWQGFADHDCSGMLWDWTIGVMPKLFATPNLTLFGSVHNLFNNTVYFNPEKKNPERWVEAGITIKY
ncbi:MAG: hypothetical protein A2511_16985 [Deltaproteobacteria bacterium RIFOXYD12_FULL_50_9]|nr:MAG: hypothetical protein A2511_16985 [Deltaproteobacteria bacterium RIFOXYD12_FULL_50_9]